MLWICLLAVHLQIVAGYLDVLAKCDPWIGCISHHEASEFLALRNKKVDSYSGSIDMKKTIQSIYFTADGITLDENKRAETLLVTWDELQEIADKKVGCYSLFDDGSKPWQIKTFSDKTNLAASLCPPINQAGAPTLLLGGFTMHRISGDKIDPIIDTENKLSSISIYPGYNVLDTCMGLGYTAIGAAASLKGSGRVTTCEFDPASIEMSSYNPWSKQLFDGSLPIDIREGDTMELLLDFPDGHFDAIIHDPPAKALCRKDLYGSEFYSLLRQKMRKSGGKLFHYIGNPESRESGRLFRGVMDRLNTVGFKNIEKANRAFGVVAFT